MPVDLTTMRDILAPGLWAIFHAKDELPLVLPERFPHLRALRGSGRIHTVQDISDLPRNFTCGDGQRYEEHPVSAGWSYPQGWGRTRDPRTGQIVYDEPDARADGKVESFVMERNELRRELDEEIGAYFEYRNGGH